jgi:hypothetical protein
MQHIRRKSLPEVFEIVRMAETKEEKVRILRAYQSRDMKYVVNGLYNVDWSDLPMPDLEELDNNSRSELAYSNINKSLPRIEKAFVIRYDNPEKSRRLIEMVLREVSADEADLLIRMFKNKKVQGITKVVFKEAYPNFFRLEDQS